jgi:hypothetical protein
LRGILASRLGAKCSGIEVYERRLPSEKHFRGIIKLPGSTNEVLAKWFMDHILSESRLSITQEQNSEDTMAHKQADDTSDLFFETICNVSSYDRWNFGGREVFRDRVLLHISAIHD